jgi:hypothetical protein
VLAQVFGSTANVSSSCVALHLLKFGLGFHFRRLNIIIFYTMRLLTSCPTWKTRPFILRCAPLARLTNIPKEPCCGTLWVTQANFIDHSSRCQNRLSQLKVILFFMDLCGAHPQDACYLVVWKFFTPFKLHQHSPLTYPGSDQVMQTLLPQPQYVRSPISMTDHKLFHDP